MFIRSHIISNALPEFGLEKAFNEGVSDDFPSVGFSIKGNTDELLAFTENRNELADCID